MAEEFELKNTDETRNYFIEELEQNELMSKKHKKVCVTLDYIEHFFYFSFCSYWMYFHIGFCFFSRYFCRNNELCNSIKNLCNNYKN